MRVMVIPILYLGIIGCATKPEHENQSPIADFSVTPSRGTIDTVFTLDPSASKDAEDGFDELEVRWDFEADDSWDTQWAQPHVIQHQFLTPGAKSVKMIVRDTAGFTNQAYRPAIVIGPPEPRATVIPYHATVDSIFTFSAETTTDEFHRFRDLEIRWDFTGDGTWDTDWSATKTITHQFDTPGAFSTGLIVRNPTGLADSTTCDVLVNPHDTPPVGILTATPSTGTSMTEIDIDARDSYDNEDPYSSLRFRWDLTSDGSWDSNWGTQALVHDYLFKQSGIITITVAVRDPWGLSDTTSTSIELENLPPIAQFSISPWAGEVTTEFTFEASASTDFDNPDINLEVRWDFNGDDLWDTGWIPRVQTETFIYDSPGIYRVILEVRDPHGLTDTEVKNLHITSPIAWQLDLGAAVISYPAFDNAGNIILLLTDNTVRSISIDGTENWRSVPGGTMRSYAAIAPDGTIWVTDEGGMLYALDNGGSVLLSHQTIGPFRGGPTIDNDGTVYYATVPGNRGYLNSLTLDGGEIWSIELGRYIDSVLSIGVGGRLFCHVSVPDPVWGPDHNVIFAIESNGNVAWQYEPASVPIGQIIPSIDGSIYIREGDFLTQYNENGSVIRTYSQIGLELLCIGPDGTLYCRGGGFSFNVHTPTGDLIWMVDDDREGFTGPTVAADGSVIVGYSVPMTSIHREYFLCHFDAGGTRQAEWLARSEMSPLISPTGRVFAAYENTLTAVDTDLPGPAVGQWPRNRGGTDNSGRVK